MPNLPEWIMKILHRMDIEEFVGVIKAHPVLWDNRSQKYTAQEASEAWMKVCSTMDKAYQERTPEELDELRVLLQKKWKNIRDCFRRELRRLNTEGDLPSKKLYRNYDLLSFLEPIMCIEQDTSVKEESCQDLELIGGLKQAPKARLLKRRKKHVEQNINEMGVFEENNSKEPEVYPRATTGDGDTLFMMSLIPEMKKIPENKRLQVKVKLMNVILEAQES